LTRQLSIELLQVCIHTLNRTFSVICQFTRGNRTVCQGKWICLPFKYWTYVRQSPHPDGM